MEEDIKILEDAVMHERKEQEALENLLKRNKELEKKDKIINNTINEIEKLRQDFSEDLQPDFIRILEILKDKKVIEW